MPNNPWKQWIDKTSWSMAKAMQDFLFQFICLEVQKAQFIFVSCNEMTIIDN